MKKLQDYHSTETHYFVVRAHLSRLACTPGSEFLMENIQPAYGLLIDKASLLKEKIEAYEDATDEIDFYDAILENLVKKLSAETKLNNETIPVYNTPFHNGGYSSIAGTGKVGDLKEMDALAGLYENLEKGHPLYTYGADLRKLVKNSKNAIERFKQSEESISNAKAELEEAKSDLRGKYRDNCIKACAQFEESKANSLFTSNF